MQQFSKYQKKDIFDLKFWNKNYHQSGTQKDLSLCCLFSMILQEINQKKTVILFLAGSHIIFTSAYALHYY